MSEGSDSAGQLPVTEPEHPVAPSRVGWLHRRPVAWQSRGFRRLTVAWLFTNVADSALYLMVAVWVKELTGSDVAAGLVFAALGVPAVLSPFLGQLADRMSRHRLLLVAYVGVAGAVATLALVDSPRWLWLIYLVVFVYGAVGYLTAAAQSGLIRDLLPDEHLASGNGLLSMIDQAMRLLSPLLGTGLYVLAGPYAVVGLTAGAFLIAAGLLAGLHVQESEPESVSERGKYWAELFAGFRHLFRTPPLGRLTLLVGIAIAATGLVNISVFPIMDQGLDVPASTLGLLVSVQGSGAIAGGATSARAIGRWGEVPTFTAGMAGLGLGIVPLMASSLAAALAGMAVIGFSVTWLVVAFVTLRQRLTPARLQGRTAAAALMAMNLPQTVMTLVGAGLLAVVDYRLLVLATVIIVLGAAIAAVPGSSQTPHR